MAMDPLDIEKTMVEPSKATGYTLAVGATLGQYRIVRKLGKGGMGEVYEVEHQVLHKNYAIKLLPADFTSQPGALERFQREAQVMANLDHPNILKVDDFGEIDGRYWLRMELATGAGPKSKGEGDVVSLQDLADEYGGKIEQEMLAGILGHILEGLKFAHTHGVVHRDLKPANILIFDSGDGCTFKVADFGLVRLVGEEWVRDQANLSMQRSMSVGNMSTMAGSEQGSSTRSMLGTFEYMSPEQKRGEDTTAQSDLYAVGLMAYRLLTGRSLGMKKPSQIDPSLASGWDDFVEQALEEEPSERLSSAADGLSLLASVAQQFDAEQTHHQIREEAEREAAECTRREQEAATRRSEEERVAAKTARKEQEEQSRPAIPAIPSAARTSQVPLHENALGNKSISGFGWYLDAWKRYAIFRGRSCRKAFWIFVLFDTIFTVVAMIVDGVIESEIGVLNGIYTLASIIPYIAVAVRRMHDAGHSGIWILIPIVNLLFLCQESKPGANKYGPNPNDNRSSASLAAFDQNGKGKRSPAGCLVVLFVGLALAGLFAAIAIPSFVKARNTSRANACINNMRVIDSAKEQLAIAENLAVGAHLDARKMYQYIRNPPPVCPAGGKYEYHRIGVSPECSVHGRLR